MRETFHRFAEDKIRPIAEHVHRANADIPEDVISGLAEIGGFGLSVPEEYDGFAQGGEHDYLGMVVATEELSWGSLGAGGSLITRPEILTRAIVHGGTEEQKRRWLPAIASGERMVGVMATEPDFGSDVGRDQGVGDADRGRLPHQRREDLGDVRRSGEHASCSSPAPTPTARPGTAGSRSSWSTRSPRRVTSSRSARVAGKMEGRAIDTIGYRGMHSYEVSFEDWFVPAENLVGEEGGLGKGFYLQMEGFENGRLQTAARAVGRHASRVRRRARVRAGSRRLRQAGLRLPALPREARPHGVPHPDRTAVLVRGRQDDGPRRRARSTRRW